MDNNVLPDNILRKIKRCMDLSKSSNTNEAATAFKQMQALMQKYNVSHNEVLAFDVSESEYRLKVKSRPARWVVQLHSVVGQALDCHCIIQRGGGENAGLIYVGVGSTPEIASYAFDVLFRSLTKDRKEFIKENLSRFKAANKTKHADAFCEGWVSNVYKKVENLNPNVDVTEKIKAYKKGMNNYEGTSFQSNSRVNMKDSGSSACAALGYLKSKDINLFAATGHTEQAKLGN